MALAARVTEGSGEAAGPAGRARRAARLGPGARGRRRRPRALTRGAVSALAMPGASAAPQADKRERGRTAGAVPAPYGVSTTRMVPGPTRWPCTFGSETLPGPLTGRLTRDHCSKFAAGRRSNRRPPQAGGPRSRYEIRCWSAKRTIIRRPGRQPRSLFGIRCWSAEDNDHRRPARRPALDSGPLATFVSGRVRRSCRLVRPPAAAPRQVRENGHCIAALGTGGDGRSKLTVASAQTRSDRRPRPASTWSR